MFLRFLVEFRLRSLMVNGVSLVRAVDGRWIGNPRRIAG